MLFSDLLGYIFIVYPVLVIATMFVHLFVDTITRQFK